MWNRRESLSETNKRDFFFFFTVAMILRGLSLIKMQRYIWIKDLKPSHLFYFNPKKDNLLNIWKPRNLSKRSFSKPQNLKCTQRRILNFQLSGNFKMAFQIRMNFLYKEPPDCFHGYILLFFLALKLSHITLVLSLHNVIKL